MTTTTTPTPDSEQLPSDYPYVVDAVWGWADGPPFGVFRAGADSLEDIRRRYSDASLLYIYHRQVVELPDGELCYKDRLIAARGGTYPGQRRALTGSGVSQ